MGNHTQITVNGLMIFEHHIISPNCLHATIFLEYLEYIRHLKRAVRMVVHEDQLLKLRQPSQEKEKAMASRERGAVPDPSNMVIFQAMELIQPEGKPKT